MSQAVFQPVGQKRHTNIAVVRLKKNGKRFEVACFKNKVVNWRQGVESDIDEVLQTHEVFANVGKGQSADTKDLQAAFGTTDRLAICKEILAKGDLQVSDKERKVELDKLFKDVASILLEKCVNPETNRPYTMGLIERGLKDIHFAVDPKRSAKLQALEAIPLLQKKFPIERAMMRVSLRIPMAAKSDLQSLLGDGAKAEEEDVVGELYDATYLIQPGSFRKLYNFVTQECGGQGRIEVQSVSVQDAGLDSAPGSAARNATAAAGTASTGLAALRIGQSEASTATPSGGGGGDGMVGGFAMQRQAVVVAPLQRSRGEPSGEVVYPRGEIGSIPDQWQNRREMFAELDTLQSGWTVELRARGSGSTVDAVFYDPAGNKVGAFAAARRQALKASKGEAS